MYNLYMKYTYKYKILTEYFLEKRNEREGGVEGYNTPFTVTFDELSNIGLNDKKEIIEMLKIIKTEVVYPFNENGNEVKTVVLNYILEEDTIKINDSSRNNLKQFLKKIEKDTGQSGITVDFVDRRPKTY